MAIKSERSQTGAHYNEQIINSLTSGVLAVDADGAVVTANLAACEHLHMDPSQLAQGARLDAFQHVKPFLKIMEELRDARQPIQRREVILSYSDGGKKEVGLSASLLEGPDDFNGVIFLFVDMTERRRLERAAEVNQQLATIGELTAGVVHELRNPVSVIRGMAELLLRKLNADDLRKTAHLIFSEAIHLEKSISQFLGFARPFELEPARCNAEEIADRALQLCARKAEDKDVQLVYTHDDELPQMRVDAARLAQAVANLVGNAVDAVDWGGRVDLVVRATEGELIIHVLDDGPGIHLEPGEDPFQPFFTRKEDGTGLGLAIVQRIVSAHQGNVSFENRKEGGTRFEIRVPLEVGARW